MVATSHVIHIKAHTYAILYHNLKEFHFLHPKVHPTENLNQIIQPGTILTSHLQSEDIKLLGISVWASLITVRFKVL